MISRIIYVPFDHLNQNYGALKNADAKSDAVVLVESQRMLHGRPWHPERLFFLVSSARHFAKQLQEHGFTVRYIKAQNTIDGLNAARREFGNLPVVAAEASSHRQLRQLTEYGVEWVPNDFFLTSRKVFASWAGSQKSFLLENFYRAQRLRLNLLVQNGKPEGDRWNFDHDNRLPPPKNYKWPHRIRHERDELDREVARELGYEPTDSWATTRAGALAQLEHFVEVNLASFGPYEDAVTSEDWSLHHSLLSPYLNNGLLHAYEVVARVLEEYRKGSAPLQSVEAFIRQVAGWREYINGMYWWLGEAYANENFLQAKEPLPPLFRDSSKTSMECLRSTVEAVETRAWTHHIPRLMILSNFALLQGIEPRQFLDWMRENFVDASDWVMVPNVIGMATFADGGRITTKPYVGGGAYLSKMTDHCKKCPLNPKLRTGDNACPFTTLYWDFLDRNRPLLEGNPRIMRQVKGLDRLSDLPELRSRALEVRALIREGSL